MSNILTKQSETTTYSQNEESITDDLQILKSEKKGLGTPIISPLEIAILENRKIAFYIPVDSEDYRESVQILLNWYVERLQKADPELTKPDYDVEIGEAPGWDGEFDEKNRLMISYVGVARF